MTLKNVISIAIGLLPNQLVFAQSCPSDDPAKIQKMIGELRDTFECNGLNFKSCNEYRGLVIAGAASGVVVGGALAAKTAAGLAMMKGAGVVCPMPGNSASLRTAHDLIALWSFGESALARTGLGCSVPKGTAIKSFDALKNEAYEKSQQVAAEMKERLLAEKLSKVDASKIQVTEAEFQNRFRDGLAKLEAEIRAAPGTAESKQWVLDAIKRGRANVDSGAGKASTRIVDAYHNIMDIMPNAYKESLSPEARTAVQYWKANDEIRSAKLATMGNSQAAKIVLEAQEDLDRLTGMGTNRAGRADFLKSRGYTAEFIKELVAVDDARTSLSMTGAAYQRASYNLATSASFKNAVTVSTEELATLSRSGGAIREVSDSLRAFRELPGLNNSLTATIRRVGSEAIAKIATSGGAKAAVKYGAPVVTGIGKAMALPVQVAYESVTFSKDPHCGGERESAYAHLKMTEGEHGGEACHSVEARTNKTDEFLYGLSPSEQLAEVRNNPGTCDLLARMYARYAPSQNWQVTCDGTVAQLSGKNSKGDGQMIRFDAASGAPANVEWYSGSFERCAKVSIKDDVFESAQVFETASGMRGCGSVGQGKLVSSSALTMRQDQSDEKRMVSEFSSWQASNSFALSAATDCCRTGTSPMNPMCSGAGRGSNPSSGSVRTTGTATEK